MTIALHQHIASFLSLITLAQNLKQELRHSWLSNGRQESVAEHSWRLSLMVLGIAPMLAQENFDTLKAVKMAIIHDLVEAIARDIPLFETQDNSVMQQEKQRAEYEAIETIAQMAGPLWGNEIKSLWLEHENQTSFEAQIVRCLDKLEAQIQHNEADLATWTTWEKERVFEHHLPKVSACHPATALLCQYVLEAAKKKLATS